MNMFGKIVEFFGYGPESSSITRYFYSGVGRLCLIMIANYRYVRKERECSGEFMGGGFQGIWTISDTDLYIFCLQYIICSQHLFLI